MLKNSHDKKKFLTTGGKFSQQEKKSHNRGKNSHQRRKIFTMGERILKAGENFS